MERKKSPSSGYETWTLKGGQCGGGAAGSPRNSRGTTRRASPVRAGGWSGPGQHLPPQPSWGNSQAATHLPTTHPPPPTAPDTIDVGTGERTDTLSRCHINTVCADGLHLYDKGAVPPKRKGLGSQNICTGFGRTDIFHKAKLFSSLKHSLVPHHQPIRGISTLAHKLKFCKHNGLWTQKLNLRPNSHSTPWYELGYTPGDVRLSCNGPDSPPAPL